MSGPIRREQAEPSSLGVVRGLLERNLVERAVALSESRWPGSGPIVRLSHEWGTLSATERRQRLAQIGPEDLARLREIANLQPDLARVLDDLEARGILPPTIAPIETGNTPQPVTLESQVDASLDFVEEGIATVIEHTRPQRSREPRAARSATTETQTPQSVRNSRNTPRPTLTPLPQVLSPSFVPTDSAAQFAERESERRARLVDETESILDRVRRNIDRASMRLISPRVDPLMDETPASFTDPEAEETPTPELQRRPIPEPTPSSSDDLQDESVTPVGTITSIVDHLASTFASSPVIEIEAHQEIPTSDDLGRLAASMGLRLVEIDQQSLPSRALYGSLVREGRSVEPRAGTLPTALSGHNLVVLRGRVLPRMVERIRDGYCDIPGTRATVRVHPRGRLLILPG